MGVKTRGARLKGASSLQSICGRSRTAKMVNSDPRSRRRNLLWMRCCYGKNAISKTEVCDDRIRKAKCWRSRKDLIHGRMNFARSPSTAQALTLYLVPACLLQHSALWKWPQTSLISTGLQTMSVKAKLEGSRSIELSSVLIESS